MRVEVWMDQELGCDSESIVETVDKGKVCILDEMANGGAPQSRDPHTSVGQWRANDAG